MSWLSENRVYIYLFIIIAVLAAVILSITLTNSKPVESATVQEKEQEEVELIETNELPSFNSIVYAVVDSYEGYIELPPDASYPEQLLQYLEEWPISGSKRLPGKTYLMNKKLVENTKQSCRWIMFNDNQYCVIDS